MCCCILMRVFTHLHDLYLNLDFMEIWQDKTDKVNKFLVLYYPRFCYWYCHCYHCLHLVKLYFVGMKYRSNPRWAGEKQSVSQHLGFHGTQQHLNMPSSRHIKPPQAFSGLYWITMCMKSLLCMCYGFPWLRSNIIQILKIIHDAWLVQNQDKRPPAVNSDNAAK